MLMDFYYILSQTEVQNWNGIMRQTQGYMKQQTFDHNKVYSIFFIKQFGKK
jgi:hypothetical protein